MTQPSRLMPPFVPAEAAVSFWWRSLGALLLVVGLGCFAWAVWAKPVIVLGAVVTLTMVGVVLERRYRAHLQRIAESRPGESICTFARALPVREVDPWIVRAVFEQLQSYLDGTQRAFPIRASDRLVEDLQVDPEDIDDVLLPEIAQRTRRVLTDIASNPYCGKVVTVEDLVRFFCAQASGAAEQGDEADEAQDGTRTAS